MKAKEWAEKFKAITEGDTPARYADLLKEFGTETAELVAARTKTSQPESRFPAADGAIREQKSKFRSLCGCGIPGLTVEMFDQLLVTAVPDYFVWQKEAQKKAEKPKQEDDAKNYRNRGRHYSRKKENHEGRQNQVRAGSNPGVGQN